MKSTRMVHTLVALPAVAAVAVGSPALPASHADNSRLNYDVYANIYTAQQQNGCRTQARMDGRLIEAARRHTFDVRDHPDVDGDIGSDGSTPQDRGAAAGYRGGVTETVAINPALAISGVEILNQWWGDPVSRAIMQDCNNAAIGVWSESSLARTVVVAVYGQPVAP